MIYSCIAYVVQRLDYLSIFLLLLYINDLRQQQQRCIICTKRQKDR